MQLGIAARVGSPEDAEFVRDAERIGVTSAWVAEAWGQDALTPLAYLAAVTDQIALGTAIAQLGARTPAMLAMRGDIFAPVLSLMRTSDLGEALAANGACPYALTAAIFGPEAEARRLAGRLRVGNVLINDIVIPTVDPRVAFGGRGRSGFGVTRGAEVSA